MTWTWFTQSTPVSATQVASSDETDPERLATIDAQVVSAYGRNEVIRISRINSVTDDEVVLFGESDNSWFGALFGQPAEAATPIPIGAPVTLTSSGTRFSGTQVPQDVAASPAASTSNAIVALAVLAIFVGGVVLLGGRQ